MVYVFDREYDGAELKLRQLLAPHLGEDGARTFIERIGGAYRWLVFEAAPGKARFSGYDDEREVLAAVDCGLRHAHREELTAKVRICAAPDVCSRLEAEGVAHVRRRGLRLVAGGAQ